MERHEMKQAATIELFSYWDALRTGIDCALRDGAPEQMRDLLAHTFLVEVDARRAYPLRVLGDTLPRVAANARLGASFLECWDVGSRLLLEAMLRVVHDERLPVVIGALACADDAQAHVEVLLVPLAGEPRGKPRILGGPAPNKTLSRRSRPAMLKIGSARAIRSLAPVRAFAAASAPQGRLPEAATPAAPTPGDLYPPLRVIEGGRSTIIQV